MEDNPFFRAVSEGGYVWACLLAFGYGVLTSLTPCVYPMIGITVSIFGARKVKRRLDGFLLSGAFVLGIAAMFSTVGLIAGLSGMVFGSLLSHPAVVIGIAVVLVALALSMFGAYEFRIPSSWQTRLSRVGGGGGHLGAFAMGLVAGIIAAPCTGPFLLGILTYIGTTGSPALGFTFLFVYSLGIGLLFLVLGTFAVSLPKGGRWMEGVKAFLGCVLVATAAYFLIIPFPGIGTVFKSGATWLAIAGGCVVAGVLAGGLHLQFRGGGALATARKTVGVVLVTAGVFGAASSLSYAEPLDWIDGLPAALAKAREERKPLLIDFTARWCGVCKGIERNVFSEDEFRRPARGVVMGRVDLSEDTDATEGGTFDILGHPVTLRGLPRILLFDAEGALVRDWGGRDPQDPELEDFLAAFRSIGVTGR